MAIKIFLSTEPHTPEIQHLEKQIEKPRATMPGKQSIPKPSAEQPILEDPYPVGTPEARQFTLQEVMIEMAQATCDRIIEEHRKRGISAYKSTPENQWAEKEITRIYHAVLDGRADIDDFKQACENWLNPISSFKAISKITGG
jgi:hypothetical protein